MSTKPLEAPVGVDSTTRVAAFVGEATTTAFVSTLAADGMAASGEAVTLVPLAVMCAVATAAERGGIGIKVGM